jgi:hypothetical protein
VLDRVALAPTLHCSRIETRDVLVPQTNHRPVLAHITLGALYPSGDGASVNRAPPRLQRPFPSQAQANFEEMNGIIAELMQTNPPPLAAAGLVVTSTDWDMLFRYCDEVFMTACRQTFRRAKSNPVNPAIRLTSSPEGDALARRKKALGRLI